MGGILTDGHVALDGRIRLHLRVEGIVQGVGFRPFVQRLATSLGLAGSVANAASGVVIEVEGPEPEVRRFTARLVAEAPPLAQVDAVREDRACPRDDVGFRILASATGDGHGTLVAADVATCAACLREVTDPTDRRHRYPFTNCTDCGPRYTIVRALPYDRARTTMAGFPRCDDCEREYADPTDRRFHAQPVCCPACGPVLRLERAGGFPVPGDPIAATADLLAAGAVVAVKGLGGHHLAVDAASPTAAAELRRRKGRGDKPFAVMVRDLAAARELCTVDAAEAALLGSAAAPIVLLRRREDAGAAVVAEAVAPGTRNLGVMLPYTPLHHLLLAAHGGPIVLTSGNAAGEPIAIDDDDARRRLTGIADAFLVSDRPIHVRADDSVVRILAGRPVPLRRSRGYAPRPVAVPWPAPRPVLAVGAQQKSTVCLLGDHHAVLSPHLGDLDRYEAFRGFVETIGHLRALTGIRPEVVAHDLHPEYPSTAYAVDLDGVDLVGVQHHHAHVAACLAEHGHAGPAIGVAFDGTGLGTDGTIWGGEVLVGDLARMERVGHLATVPLPGGAAAVREPWRMAAAHLRAAYGDDLPRGLDVHRRHRDAWDTVVAAAEAGLNAPLTSSAGRLLDAVAAILGVRDLVTYEGQAAIELEQLADPGATGAHEMAVHERDGRLVMAAGDLVRAVVDDLRAGLPVPVVAARVHHGVVATVGAVVDRVRRRTGLSTVALSGGVFQNALLVEHLVATLSERGCTVLTHTRVPPNDGGISFGQAMVVAARDRSR